MKTTTNPVVTVSNTDAAVMELLTNFRAEAKVSGSRWAATAKNIVTILETMTPGEAQKHLRTNAKGIKNMNVSVWYIGSADRLRLAIRADERKAFSAVISAGSCGDIFTASEAGDEDCD